MDFSVIILAAGKGTRMKSNTVKVLHPLASRPMLAYILDLGWQLGPKDLFAVVGCQADRVREIFSGYSPPPQWIVQPEQKGTGDAVRCTLPYIHDTVQTVVILYGDVPLLKKNAVDNLIATHQREKAAMTILTAMLDDPHGYGRIVRDGNRKILRIVEQADAREEEKKVREINTGIYCIQASLLRDAIDNLTADNAQGEYYLTDLVDYAAKKDLQVGAVLTDDPFRSLGVNSRGDLAVAEQTLREETCSHWMSEGVTIVDPLSTYIGPSVSLQADTILEPGCHLRGDTQVGSSCTVGVGSIIVDSMIGSGACIRPYSVIQESRVGENVSVGPMAHLRSDTILATGVCVGNFVETKNAKIQKDSIAAHHAYLGDCEIGERVNIGCGTITCNFDGHRKYKTIIEDDVFIGSDSQLIAPVRVGKEAYIGSGSTITEDVPAGALALSRSSQKTKKGWTKSKNKPDKEKED